MDKKRGVCPFRGLNSTMGMPNAYICGKNGGFKGKALSIAKAEKRTKKRIKKDFSL